MMTRTGAVIRKALGFGWLVKALTVLALASPMIWALSTRVQNLIETPLTSDRGDRLAVPIELSYLSYPGSNGAHAATMNLQLGNLDVLVSRRTLEIFVVELLDQPPSRIRHTLCRGDWLPFRDTPLGRLGHNRTVPFVRGRGCAPLQGRPTGVLELVVRFNGPGRVGVWTYRPQGPPTDPNIIYLPDPSWSDIGLKVELRGNYVIRGDAPTTAARIYSLTCGTCRRAARGFGSLRPCLSVLLSPARLRSQRGVEKARHGLASFDSCVQGFSGAPDCRSCMLS